MTKLILASAHETSSCFNYISFFFNLPNYKELCLLLKVDEDHEGDVFLKKDLRYSQYKRARTVHAQKNNCHHKWLERLEEKGVYRGCLEPVKWHFFCLFSCSQYCQKQMLSGAVGAQLPSIGLKNYNILYFLPLCRRIRDLVPFRSDQPE